MTETTGIPASPVGIIIKSEAEGRSLLSPQECQLPRPTDEGRP